MVNVQNKSSGPHKTDYLISSIAAPPKRSGSGKTKKPKSGRQISRNNKKAAIYTIAPVMNMAYKKKVKNFK